ncbi:predicted protein [Naegleria gruberi]|uniref:Predicted protein n=1 Tax=Naegleria gruberi TaxID=5762 RepID=D2VMI8_NAEGR|nr:uncharacterized protein NAEGRDRAFT_70151 [Naegleria gruberi]EFC42071.1 predicted protein [Naegleria gruberi]|eukprot:XP_002674815.1 predicted protein [Naegleria gruberi strain NEG-M]
MKRLQIACCFDKFKDSLKARECGKAIMQGLGQVNYDFVNIPLSDGGEGFLEAIKKDQEGNYQLDHVQVRRPVRNSDLMITVPYFRKQVENNFLYVLEMATVCGLELLKMEERNPFNTSTFGLGVVIGNILKQHGKKDHIHILMGIGGSCTNDAGLGCLKCLGCVDIELNGKLMSSGEVFWGGDLINISDILINTEGLPFQYENLTIDIACDVNNPFIGERGAVHTFSKQKGATEEQREILEKGMNQVAKLIQRHQNIDISNLSGAGAAGGIAGGFYSILNGQVNLKKGIEMIGAINNLEQVISQSDIVFTGEGSYDHQSEGGKVVSWIAQLCKKYSKPCIILCGQKKIETLPNENCLAFDLISKFKLEECMSNTFECLAQLAKEHENDILKKRQGILN